MLGGKFALPVFLGRDDGIDGDLVQGIEKLGYPGHGRRRSLAAVPDAEMPGDVLFHWQPAGGPVDGQQAEAEPRAWIVMRFKILEHLQIQFDKGFESELHSSLGQGRLGYNPFGDIEPANGLEEFIEFVLIGAPHEIDEKNDQDVKGEFSLPGEIFFAMSVASDKIRGRDNLFKKTNQLGTCIGNQVPCQSCQLG